MAHIEELDGCDHGATGKECREDPSTNGKDCEVHGQHGGINEDHCLSTTTTTTAPTTTTTTLSPVASTTTTTTTGGAASSPSTTTTLPTTPSVESSAPAATTTSVAVPTLPRTGASSLDLAGIGLALVIGGVSLRRRMRRA